MKREQLSITTYNEHQVGIVMKEMVRRAIHAIRNQRQIFEVNPKKGYSGAMDDMLTSADLAAQKIYIRTIRECFPDWGVIAEEDSLAIRPKNPQGLFFTVDPLDGTKAFVRKQSHGVGTMISLCDNNGFVSAYVGNINTQEIVGFRPGSKKVHRITEFNTGEALEIDTKSLDKKYILLRDPLRKYSKLSQVTVDSLFKNYSIDGGSIGTWMARMWTGEVGAVLVDSSYETPWDSNPIFAICEKLGFVYFKPSKCNDKWVRVEMSPIKQKYLKNHDLLIVHRSNAKEIARFKA